MWGSLRPIPPQSEQGAEKPANMSNELKLNMNESGESKGNYVSPPSRSSEEPHGS